MKLYVCLNKFFCFPMSLYRLVGKYIFACYFERIKKTSQEIMITKIWRVDLPALLISGVEVMKSMAVCSGLSSAAHDIPSFFCRRGGVCCNSFKNKNLPSQTFIILAAVKIHPLLHVWQLDFIMGETLLMQFWQINICFREFHDIENSYSLEKLNFHISPW